MRGRLNAAVRGVAPCLPLEICRGGEALRGPFFLSCSLLLICRNAARLQFNYIFYGTICQHGGVAFSPAAKEKKRPTIRSTIEISGAVWYTVNNKR